MKKTIIITLVLFAVLALSGCVTSTGFVSDSASLSQANFSYSAMNVSGKSDTFYILGIGGFNKDALVVEAKEALTEAHPVSDNQAYTNMSVNFKYEYYVVYIKVTCTVTADIVEFK